MSNNSLRTYKYSFCYFLLLQNKISHRHSYSLFSHVVLFTHPIILNILTRSKVTKMLQKSYIVNLIKLSFQFNQENTWQNFVS